MYSKPRIFTNVHTQYEFICVSGGKYRGQLIQGETTHLIGDSTDSNHFIAIHRITVGMHTDATGAKYRAAIKWKIPVVNKSWFYDSLKMGYCRNPADYALEGSTSSSVQNTTTVTSVVGAHLVDESSAFGGGPAPKNSTPKTATRFSVVFDENMSRISNANGKAKFYHENTTSTVLVNQEEDCTLVDNCPMDDILSQYTVMPFLYRNLT